MAAGAQGPWGGAAGSTARGVRGAVAGGARGECRYRYEVHTWDAAVQDWAPFYRSEQVKGGGVRELQRLLWVRGAAEANSGGHRVGSAAGAVTVLLGPDGHAWAGG